MAAFAREDLQSYASSARPEYEAALEKIVEIPSVSVDPAHKADVRRAAELAVSMLESAGGRAKISHPPPASTEGRSSTSRKKARSASASRHRRARDESD